MEQCGAQVKSTSTQFWLRTHLSAYLKSHCFLLDKMVTKLAPELYKE